METYSPCHSTHESQAAPSPHVSSPYTVVDVKFEAGAEEGGSLVTSLVREREGSTEENTNKRKRNIPKKLSVDEENSGDISEDEMEMGMDMSSVVKVEYNEYSDNGYEDIAASAPEFHSFPQEYGEESLAAIRATNQQYNSQQREDCPVCGDKANGLHYGIYSCEGCKNFFKRSVVVIQNKPYVCPNQNDCDVRIVYDKSGIKRKGARCQSCRYSACLNAGMSHPGFPRQRGGRFNVAKQKESPNKQLKLENSNSNGSGEVGEVRSLALYNDMDNGHDSSWDDINANASTPNVSVNSWDSLNEQLSSTATNIMESLQNDELEKEQSLNRELHSRLMEKENQLKISERQNEKLRRQNVTVNTLVKIQEEQIKRLKLELSKMSDKATRNGDFQETEYGPNHEAIGSK